MADLETVRTIMTQAVPFNRVLGLQFIAVEAESAEVMMPEAPERLNHVGTIHAAIAGLQSRVCGLEKTS